MRKADKKKCALIFDCEFKNSDRFANGIKDSLNMEVVWFNYVANNCGKIKRYALYMLKPFQFLFKMKKYSLIICWQQFYGIFLLFFTRIFHLKKDIAILNFIYIDKRGILGNVFYKFISFCIKSRNLKKIFVNSSAESQKYSELFNIPIDKFYYQRINFNINDYPKLVVKKGKYFVSAGRSNRDYDFLVNTFKSLDDELYIVCDTYKPKTELTKNIHILKDCFNDSYFKLLSECFASIISLGDSDSSSGQLAIFDSAQYSKPIIVTKNKGIEDYLVPNCILIDKNIDSLKSAIKSLKDEKFYSDKTVKNDYNNEAIYFFALNIGTNIKLALTQ